MSIMKGEIRRLEISEGGVLALDLEAAKERGRRLRAGALERLKAKKVYLKTSIEILEEIQGAMNACDTREGEDRQAKSFAAPERLSRGFVILTMIQIKALSRFLTAV